MENRQQIMASFSDDARETQRAKREGRPSQYRSYVLLTFCLINSRNR